MSKIENYTAYAEKIAKDDTHGYDQKDRNGNPNFDCSGLVIKAVNQSGIAVKKAGATYTGNMKKAFLSCGFTDVTKKVTLRSGKGLVRGDILLNEGHHTAIYCGNGKMVDARINEKGTTTGGKSGDQTGHEIEIHRYNNHPWGCVLRYTAESSKTSTTTATKKTTTQIAQEVINGKWGNDPERAKKLKQAGYDPKSVQAKVNELTKKSTSTKKEYKEGDIVNFKGKVHYPNAGKNATGKTCKGGKAKITQISKGSAHPYHLVAVKGGGATVYGWVDKGTF